ncbi:MAG: hypothetical protein K2G23_04240, partial [Muribaculaceae bacterium]|nr:hypothetical protein [Muribaculaceae bacterium]
IYSTCMAKYNFNIASAIRIKTKRLALLAGAFLFSISGLAAETAWEVSDAANAQAMTEERESIFGGNKPLDNSHFTWGADLGASVDLTAHDMSTFDLDFVLGYKNKIIKTAGVGVGIHRTVQGGDHFIPVYALIRTSFTSRPSLQFLNARFGYSFNTVEDSPMFGDYSSALGCGFNLSQSKKAKTYLILGVAYRYFNKRHQDYISRLDTPSIWMAQLQFGVNF